MKDNRDVDGLIDRYAKTWTTLVRYDEGTLGVDGTSPAIAVLDYVSARSDIDRLKAALIDRGEASSLFGLERGEAFRAILGSIDQTMFDDPLYRSADDKAANLFYLIVKDHPFADGNKRIGAFMFVRYLQMQNMTSDISPDALGTLALLVAGSVPAEKDMVVRLIMTSMSSHRRPSVDPGDTAKGPQPGRGG